MNALVNAIPNQTMSSREIATVVGSRHADVIRTIDRLVEKSVIAGYTPSAYTHEQNGQTYKEYLVNERDSYVVVAQLCPEFTARLVDYWQASKKQIALPQSFAEALQLAADQAKQLELAAPKVSYYDKVVERSTLLNASQVAQKLKISAIKMNQLLDAFNVYSRGVKRARLFQQWFIDKGFGEVKQTELGYSQPMFTTKGEAWVIEKLVSEGVVA